MGNTAVDTSRVLMRTEKKYLLDEKILNGILGSVAPYMHRGEYGAETVSSIYYDNDDYELIQKSVEKPVFKEKFRIRTYGLPSGNDTVFAEIKRKYDGQVYKRRVAAPMERMKQFLEKGTPLEDSIQIQNEILWMIKRYGLKPKVWIASDRTEYVSNDDSQLRITFDRNLRFRKDHLDLGYSLEGTPFGTDGLVVMEIKSALGLPRWLLDAIEKNGAKPGSFSKIGRCFEEEIFTENERG